MAPNHEDLHRIRFRQRVLRDVAKRNLSTTVLGRSLSMPVVLAPVGFGGMFARRAEVQAARAAESAGVAFCESTLLICSLEEVAAATSRPLWFQLYMMKDRSYAEELVARARATGCDTLVLTVDPPMTSRRHREERNGLEGGISEMRRACRALGIAVHRSWVRQVALGGRPLTFGNLERAVPRGRVLGDFQEWVAVAGPRRHQGRLRLAGLPPVFLTSFRRGAPPNGDDRKPGGGRPKGLATSEGSLGRCGFL